MTKLLIIYLVIGLAFSTILAPVYSERMYAWPGHHIEPQVKAKAQRKLFAYGILLWRVLLANEM
jgi:hypothetical protein